MFCNTEFFYIIRKNLQNRASYYYYCAIFFQFTESSEALQKDVNCNKSKEHFLTAIRTLELMQVGFKT